MIIKLGLSGSEIDLEQDSLTLSSVELQETSSSTRSADRTLHTDYTPVKRIFTLNYEVVCKSCYDSLQAIYDSQISSLQDLNYILDEGAGLSTYKVRMQPVSKGADMRDKRYYRDIQIILEEI